MDDGDKTDGALEMISENVKEEEEEEALSKNARKKLARLARLKASREERRRRERENRRLKRKVEGRKKKEDQMSQRLGKETNCKKKKKINVFVTGLFFLLLPGSWSWRNSTTA